MRPYPDYTNQVDLYEHVEAWASSLQIFMALHLPYVFRLGQESLGKDKKKQGCHQVTTLPPEIKGRSFVLLQTPPVT